MMRLAYSLSLPGAVSLTDGVDDCPCPPNRIVIFGIRGCTDASSGTC